MMHFNIRSLPKNLTSLNDFILTVKETPEIIAISETKLQDENIYNISIPGYVFLNINSPTRGKSYLSNRKQYVALGEAKSPEQTMLCGIPQGSTLGPLLFLVVEQLFVRGQIMQMCHSLRCKLLAENIESLGTSFL